MLLLIESHVGVGDVRYGMSVEDVRRLLPGPVEAFMKAPFSAFPTDAFSSGIHVHYRPPGIVTAVEIFTPSIVALEGVKFLGEPYRTCAEALRKLDPKLEEEPTGCTSRSLGIGLFASGAQKDPEGPVEGVIAFERGYYDHEEWSVDAEKLAAFQTALKPKKRT